MTDDCLRAGLWDRCCLGGVHFFRSGPRFTVELMLCFAQLASAEVNPHTGERAPPPCEGGGLVFRALRQSSSSAIYFCLCVRVGGWGEREVECCVCQCVCLCVCLSLRVLNCTQT